MSSFEEVPGNTYKYGDKSACDVALGSTASFYSGVIYLKCYVVKYHCHGLAGHGKLTLQFPSADFSSWVSSFEEVPGNAYKYGEKSVSDVALGSTTSFYSGVIYLMCVLKNHCHFLTGLGKLTLQSPSANFSSWVIFFSGSCDTFKNLLPGLNCFRICTFKAVMMKWFYFGQ